MTRLWSWTVNILAFVGAASLLALAWFFLSLYLEPENARRMALPLVSPVAKDLAAKVAPGLVAAAKAYEPAFLSEASNPLSRWAGAKIYPVVVEKLPAATEVGCDHLLTEFGGWTVQDIISLVVRHAEQKAEPVSDSLRAYHHEGNR